PSVVIEEPVVMNEEEVADNNAAAPPAPRLGVPRVCVRVGVIVIVDVRLRRLGRVVVRGARVRVSGFVRVRRLSRRLRRGPGIHDGLGTGRRSRLLLLLLTA